MPGVRHLFTPLANFLLLLVLFVSLVAGGLAYFVVHSRQQAVNSHLDIAALYSRMFEYQLTRTLSLTEQTLAHLLTAIGGDTVPVVIEARLQQALRNAPHLRSLSVLDAEGTVIHSSNPRNIGHQPAPAGLESIPSPGAGLLRIGTPWQGRDIADGYPLLPTEASLEPVLRGFLVVSMVSDVALDATLQERWTLLAALNIDHFVSEFTHYLDPARGFTRILHDDQRLLISTRVEEWHELGRPFAVPLLRESDFPEQRESRGLTVRGEHKTLSAYRVSSLFPVVIVTDLDYRAVMTDWWLHTRNVALLVGTLCVAITLLLCWLYVEQRRRNRLHAQTEQREREHLTAVLDNLPASIVMFDHAGRVVTSNRTWQRLTEDLGWTGQPSHYCDHQAIAYRLGADERQGSELARKLAAVVEGRISSTDLILPVDMPGSAPESPTTHRWLHWIVRHVKARQLQGAVMMLLDVTRQQQASEQLKLASRVFESTAEGIVVTDRHLRVVWVNRAFQDITGYPESDVVGRRAPLISATRDAPATYRAIRRALQRLGRWQGETINFRRDGTPYHQQLTLSTLSDLEGRVTHYVGVFADISERKATEARIRHLSEHDFLTGLPNRTLFQDRLSQLIAQGRREQRRFALLFIDLDRFKRVNDTYGHRTGDELLCQVAERLRHCVRDSDTVSRQGGDEFLLLLREIQRVDDPGRVAAKIIETFKRPYLVERTPIVVSPSIGIALYPDDGQDVETLIRHADTAMYFSKAQGRNTYHFFRPEMNVDVQRRLQIENGLREAILNDELVLYYQPQCAMDNRRLIGLEALVRWNHPEHGQLAPDQFIPIAEESGLIATLGDWVLRRACRQIRNWRAAGLNTVPVAINVAATQFANPGFFDSVRRSLDDHGLTADAIELEVTESSLLQTVSKSEGMISMNRLKSLGIQLAIDDFGTGYSSLSYLRRLPVDKLKIDRSFVRDICDDPEDALITEAIVRMAHGIGLSVLAEGVETVEQLNRLRSLGCDSFQGYLHSPPLPAEEVALRLAVAGKRADVFSGGASG